MKNKRENTTRHITTCPELLVSCIWVGKGDRELCGALDNICTLSISEDIEAVDPSSRLWTRFIVVGVRASFEWTNREKVGEEELHLLRRHG